MDYEPMRSGLEQAIPFNRHLGLQVLEVADGRGVVLLPEGDELMNHVGSQHAGGLFSAGEAASGGAFVGAFAEHMGGDHAAGEVRPDRLPEARQGPDHGHGHAGWRQGGAAGHASTPTPAWSSRSRWSSPTSQAPPSRA